MPALTALIRDADTALGRGPYTVTDKSRAAPSGDLQDYTSVGPYWWPDPDKPGGLPYHRRDGVRNPERLGDDFDNTRLNALIDDVRTLGLAFWFTRESRYAAHAQTLLTVWFNNPDTRMNPNLNYGQAIPGRTDGRGIGIIDTRKMGELIDSVQLLAQEGGIDKVTYQGVRTWFAAYTKWLVTSPLGKDERAAKNNHGTYYDLQLIHFSMFFGDCEFARARLDDVKTRIDSQITAFGRMPREEARTRSLHYYIFNSLAFIQIGRLAEHLGEDLHRYKGRRGQSLLSVLTYLAGFAGREEAWPHPQIGASSQTHLARLMTQAAKIYDDARLKDAAQIGRPLIMTDAAMLIWNIGADSAVKPAPPD